MKRQILISSIILLFIQNFVSASTLYVPSRDYPTIQSAITAANPATNDVVVVAPGVYIGTGNVDLDFGGKAITVKSTINPASPNPAIIAATIIDCQGTKDDPHRAFRFHNHEDPNSKVLGFTIRNGYARGLKGADGAPGYNGDPLSDFIPIPPCDDPNDCPPYALNGANASGSGYGGAILCEAASSPTIKYCVVKNCAVTGAQGGRGADGQNGTWLHWTLGDEDPCNPGQIDPNAVLTENPDGQWGGSGGAGSGNGYGGAVACRGGSSPIISNCNISDNFARGGCGGDGGAGGNAVSSPANASPPNYSGGNESFGGDAGSSMGDGIGGGIYAENGSSPIITSCIFSNNIATTGARAAGGSAGQGNAIPDDEGGPATNGASGLVYSTGGIAGGAAYYATGSHVNDTNCTFTGNKAYEAYSFYQPYYGEDISAYTVGGALYSVVNNTITLDTCTFTGNLGGAVYCNSGCNLNFDDCLFSDNSETANGGAVYIEAGGTANLRNCIFGGNSAYDDGGALECRSNATLTSCSFGGNRADSDNDGYGYGGAIDAYRLGTTLKVDFNSCSFSGNQAIYGGGFSSENFDANFIDCYFIGNTAHDGGGLDLVNGDFFVTGGVVKENNATDGDGGGFDCWYTIAEIRNCTISDNSADGVYPTSGNGGAINFYGWASPQTVFNCLITGNSAAVDGGAIFCSNATPEIGNCTFSGNLADGYGGAIFSDWSSSPQITDCIFEGCNSHAIHEEDFGGNAIVKYSLFFNNPNRDYYESDTSTSYNFGSVADPNGNFNKDPLFVSGDLGGYYLSQIAAGQGSNSPAINNGSDTAANLGLDTFTTRTDNVGDAGQVDRGYHYRKSTEVGTFQLTASVVGGHGSIAPASGPHYAGTFVTLTATPNTGWRVKAWNGTDDDSSTATTNTVTMNSNRTVTVEFEQPRTLIVAVDGDYSTIQDAVSDAENSDTIVVYPGIYNGGYEGVSVYVDKSITIRSMNPDDPCCVAATIIDGYRQSPFQEGYTNDGVTFGPQTNADTVFNGFTIRNCGGKPYTGEDGTREDPHHPNGWDGGTGAGAAIQVSSGGGPVIKNCIIRDNVVIGGDGGAGIGADDTHNAGRGGWGGAAWGGAVYCDVNSSPTFINCQIIDNYAQGGDGGDGGNGVLDGGYANYGGNWSMTGSPEYPAWDINPDSLNWNYVFDKGLWEVWGYLGDYRWYSAYGGGVFCNTGSTVTFIHCTISRNRTIGGVSGQGGEQPPSNRPFEPLIPYEIPTFGGGVYCAAESTITFTDCTITNNLASEPNQNNNHLDPYLGHGGGVCAEDTATLKFTNCTFSENDADAGGGLHFADANAVISDCNFTFNSAYQGGGLFGEHGPATIRHSNFTNNIVFSDANDPNVVILGDGGGLHLWATDANIIDCNISSNQAEASGGGVFFGGEGTSSLTNCLLTNNAAGRDGGGVSANIFSQLTISNCTIADNTGLEYGGGVYCSYNSYVNIINSIIWNNIGIYGSQLAIATGFEYDQSPSAMRVTYTDIGPRYDPNTFTVPIFDDSFGGSSSPSVPSTVLVDSQNIYGQFDAGQGQVKVIVSMPEPAELMAATDWDSPESVAELRAEIASRQSAVLSTLTPSEFSLRHSYENIAGFSGEITGAGLEKLLQNPLVAHIEPVRQVCPALAQAIPLANALGARQVYNGAGAAIAIVDTGIDYRHPMLGGGGFPNSKVIGGYDTGNNDNDPLPVGVIPDVAHGTCCAGIAAGSLGVVGDYIGGVAPGAKLYALKASPDNAGYFLTDAELAAWDWCITHRNDDTVHPIKVMSNSWAMSGLPFNDRGAADAYSPAHTALVETAVAAGITVLAASGNDGFAGDGISWPAAMSKVISVGAVYDTTDQVTGYSNTAEILDILAPGDPIYTTDIIGAGGYTTGDYEPNFGGTSAACPFAAGCVADIQTAAQAKLGRYLAPAEVKSLLVIAGNPVTDTKVAITKPRVNLGNAIAGLEMSPIYIEKGCELNGWEAPDTNNYWGWDPNKWPNSHNIDENPYFVAGYYLSQVVAGQLINSKCVDTGSDTAANLGMDEYTTRTDGMFDVDIVDMGYHYLVAAWVDSCRLCELFHDGIINFEDFAVLASNWLSEDCSWGNDWCEHADVTFDGYVNFKDVLLFTECWLTEDTETPFPNPSEWEVEPYSGSTTSITMTARTAVDRWGGTVEYYFKCVSGGGNDSGWQSDPNYIDPNLVSGVEYGYKVRARDASEEIPNDGTGEPGNKTGWSPICYAIAGEVPPPLEDHNPPIPNPMTWATVPYATSPTSIAMVATTATDDTAGVEYYFEDFDVPTVNSGWQGSPAWQDTTCEPNTTYTYRVRARDTSPWYNQTGWSTVIEANTPAEGEEPNEPDTNPPVFGEPNEWEVEPYETGSGLDAYANMTAQVAIDPEGNGVLYYFQCADIPSINSGWTTERVWNNVPIGRTGQGLEFHFRVRDNLGNTSGWSTSLPCY